MNTDPKNNQIRSGAPLHPEQTATDTNSIRIYEITLHITEYRVATVTVPASCEVEARERAERQKVEAAWLVGSEIQVGDIQLLSEFVREEVCDVGA